MRNTHLVFALLVVLLVVGCAEVGPFRGIESSGSADAGEQASDDAGGDDLPPIGEAQLLYEDDEFPTFVAVDGDSVYWSTLGSPDNALRRAPKDGGGSPMELARVGDAHELTVADGYLYWIDGFREGSSLERLSIDGGEAEVLIPTVDYAEYLVVHDDFVYLTAEGPGGDTGSLLRVPRAGGEAVALTEGEQLSKGVAIDGESIYWGTWREIFKAPLGDIESKQVVTDGQSVVADLNLAGAEMFWIDRGNYEEDAASVRRRAGASFQVLASGFHDVADLHVAGDFVYWTRVGTVKDGQIVRYDIRNGTVDTVRSDLNRPLGMASDDRFLYWVIQGGDRNDRQGSIWRMRYR